MYICFKNPNRNHSSLRQQIVNEFGSVTIWSDSHDIPATSRSVGCSVGSSESFFTHHELCSNGVMISLKYNYKLLWLNVYNALCAVSNSACK